MVREAPVRDEDATRIYTQGMGVREGNILFQKLMPKEDRPDK